MESNTEPKTESKFLSFLKRRTSELIAVLLLVVTLAVFCAWLFGTMTVLTVLLEYALKPLGASGTSVCDAFLTAQLPRC